MAISSITALQSFPNYEDYRTEGKVAYANAVRTWLSELLSFQTQTNTSIGEMNTATTTVTDAQTVVVAKEALVNPHYAAIDGVYANEVNINAVNSNETNINNAVLNESNINSAVSNESNINSVAANNVDITTVAEVISNVNTNATNIASINTNASNISSVNTNADNISAIKLNASNMTDIQNASANAESASISAGIALGAVNYKGDWTANYNTDGYGLGMSVTYSDGYSYISKIDNNLVEPTSVTNTNEWDWVEAVDPSSIYSKTESDNALALKADQATTYSKAEVNTIVSNVSTSPTQAQIMAYIN